MAESSGTLRSVLFLGVAGSILALGWNEPLRYRFMSPTAIVREQQALREQAAGFTQPRRSGAWQPQGTSLDRGAYRTNRRGGVSYTHNMDTRELGVRTETETRKGLR